MVKTDELTARDEAEVIDGSERNVVEERTRHARPVGTYREPGDEEGLPENDGRSAIHQ